jgi:hypothetical protein
MGQYASEEEFQNGTVDLTDAESGAKAALLLISLRLCRWWMLRKVLAQFGGKLLHSGAHVLVERLNNGRYGLTPDRLVVGIVAAPDGPARFRVIYVEMDIEPRHEFRFINLVQRFQIGADDKVAFGITAGTENRAVFFGRAQIADKQILHHVGGRLGPTLELVSAKFNRAGAENDSIIPVEMRGDRPGHKEGDRKLRGWLSGRWRGNVEHVVFRRTRATTSGHGCSEYRHQHCIVRTTH